jgi:hypothetical protein
VTAILLRLSNWFLFKTTALYSASVAGVAPDPAGEPAARNARRVDADQRELVKSVAAGRFCGSRSLFVDAARFLKPMTVSCLGANGAANSVRAAARTRPENERLIAGWREFRCAS